MTYSLQVTGAAGSPVLLLPGGAASSRGFFPGLVAALEGHRVLELDRPGTGLAVDGGVATLASGAAAAAEAINEVGAGPAVVVGQSLGGAVALQLVTDFPEVVAGLVLIDPTPVNHPASLKLASRVFSVTALPSRVPVVGGQLDALMWKLMATGTKASTEETRAALEVMLRSASLATTAKALDGILDQGAALTSRLTRLQVPAVLMTADRKPGHAIRRAHEQLMEIAGGRVVSWPGAIHAEQVRDPQRVNDLVLSVVAEASRS